MTVTIRVNGLTITHRGSGRPAQQLGPRCLQDAGRRRAGSLCDHRRQSRHRPGTTTVHADGGNMIAIRPSIFTRCSGDEAGSMGGIISGTFLKRNHWITYSPNVRPCRRRKHLPPDRQAVHERPQYHFGCWRAGRDQLVHRRRDPGCALRDLLRIARRMAPLPGQAAGGRLQKTVEDRAAKGADGA
ncbi:PAAR-like domain-containing protein [Paracoccus kondratievae]|uniref:PAAR-like domain-containing protein n=1 Tax=Paracoccus kondratievae TaxID=135740 RepID=UPI001D0D33C2|nr:PAAR-like domain-containing protein [Paracoccus kondratievae]